MTRDYKNSVFPASHKIEDINFIYCKQCRITALLSVTNVNTECDLHLWKQNKEGIVSYVFYKHKAIIIKLYIFVFICKSYSYDNKYKITSHLNHNSLPR